MFLFSLLIPIHFSFAIFYTPSIGSQSNPLYIQVGQDPTQLWQSAWDKINSMQYVAACSSKYDSVKSLATKNGFGDIGDPSTAKSEANYLNYLYSSYQLCVNNAAQTQNTIQHTGTLCNGTYYNACPVGENFVCPSAGSAYCEIPKTNDQKCQGGYGLNSNWDGTKNDKGDLICDCKTGYVFNKERTSCIVAPVVSITNNPVSSGGEIKSTITCNGKEWNNCPVGQKFSCPSAGDAQCLIIPKAVTPIPKKEIAPAIEKVETDSEKKINDDICKSIDINSYHNSKLSIAGYPACRCVSGYIRLKSEDPCVIDTNVVVSNNQDTPQIDNSQNIEKDSNHKSLWSRIKGWFGF